MGEGCGRSDSFQNALYPTRSLLAPPCSRTNWWKYFCLSLEFLTLIRETHSPSFQTQQAPYLSSKTGLWEIIWFLFFKVPVSTPFQDFFLLFCWVLSHVSIQWNERANEAAWHVSCISLRPFRRDAFLPLFTLLNFSKDSLLAGRDAGLRIFGTPNYIESKSPWGVGLSSVGWVAPGKWY